MTEPPVKLLYLEDNEMDRRAFVRLVRERALPWRVTYVDSLAHARSTLAENHFNLIVADYHLPDGHSTELFDVVSDTPFVLLTGTLEEELALRTLERGADDYLAKVPDQSHLAALPFTVEKVLIRKHLREREQELTRKLRESEQQLRATVENAASGIVRTDGEDRLVAVNERICQMLGYPREQLLGMTVRELTYSEDRPRSDEVNAQIRQGRISMVQYEKRYLKRDGSPLWVHVAISGVHDEVGRYQYSVGTIIDISGRKAAEEQLRLQAAALAAAPNAISLSKTDREGTIVWVNRAFTALTGYPESEVVGKNHHLLNSGTQGETFYREMWATILRGEVWRGELVNRRKDGTVYTEEMGITPLRDEQGKVTHYIAIKQDVTARKRAELALAQANERLVEADRRKDEFLGVLSHELRNPLAPIRNAIHILKRAPDGSDQAARAKAVIERQTNQLSRLVDDILDVTRISRGKIQLNRSRFELTELLRHVVEDHRPVFDSRAIALSLRVDDGPQWIDGDSARIAQVIGNLLHNAAKFTNAHGHVVVTVARDRSSRVAVHVTDDGIGMTPDMLRRVFEPFSQADESLHRSHGGLGLGLALVKALVEMHDGRVEVSSGGPGKGADFSVSLPVLQHAEVALEAPAEGQRVNGHLRALIIEDNVDAAETLKEVLEMDGHEVSVEFDGGEGVARAHELGPDLVLCDIGLPGLDGYEVARQIRADRSISPTLIALTGYTRPEDQRKTFKAGFDHHLGKPVSISELVKLLASVSAHRTARRILVVDDNDALRENLRELLEDEGWEVRVARDGNEAVEAASGFAPAVILLDYRLGGMNGGEVLRRLGALHAASQVVLMTASPQVRELALQHGLRFYVPKPFQSDELLDTVEHARSRS
jgi:PAS domain S-box-containing protein